MAKNDWDEAVRPALARLVADDGRVPNVFATFARHPGLFRRWLALGGHLLHESTLPPRVREMVILRTAALAGSRYEWTHHVIIGRAAGLADDEIARIEKGPDDPGWAEADRAVLRAVDELHRDNNLTDQTWSALAGGWRTEQLMDLVMTVGFYTMTAMSLNAFGVELDPGL